MNRDQRRSARIRFSIPVTIRGVDKQGHGFETVGRTITVNRHGARVHLAHSLKVGQTIQVINQVNNQETDFWVVRSITPELDGVGDWGMETVQAEKNIWDIHFPASEEDVDAHVLLECRHCRSRVLQSISLEEVEILETAGLLSNLCVRCGTTTPWGYSQEAYSLESQTDQATVAGSTVAVTTPVSSERRRAPRKLSQLPVRVRDYFGETEIAQTENTSQDGFCFSSSRKYLVGQGIVAICPYDLNYERPEVRAHIVREEPGGDDTSSLYGVRYARPSHW